MNKKSRTTATILLVALLLSIFLPAMTLSASLNSTETPMLKTEDIFGGSFSPQEKVVASGETFDVTFSLCPTMDAPNTVVSFVLPADLVKLVSGNQVWTSDLKKGESSTLTLTLAANGEVAAYVKADVEALLSGKDYRSSYYLHVATPNAGFSSVAASGSMEPGSLREVNLEYASTAPSPTKSRATENFVAPLSAGDIEVKGQFWFVDENGGWSVARYMLIRLRDNKDASWSATQWSDGDGKFDFVVANSAGGRSPILDIIAEGTWDWNATNGAGAQYWWSTGVIGTSVPDGWLYENNGLGVASNSETLQAGDAVFLEMNWVYWMSGVYWSRSRVKIVFPYDTWPNSHGNSIHLPSKSTAGWNHVTVQHEDGHCVMYTLYGNTFPYTAHPSESHYVFSEKDGGFAIIEGWAEFMQCVVDNNANNLADWYSGHGGNIETNDWFNCIDTGDMDGNIVEGSCASILWDIFDPVNIAGDNDHMAWNYEEIFTVMRYDHPGNMTAFWDNWAARWPTNSTSMGPMCDIYYHYGIDEDWFNPWGSIVINGGALYTTSRTVTLTLDGEDWGVGVQYMRFSEDWGVTWGGWYNYATTFTYTIQSAGDGYKYIDVQYADFWWLSNGGTIYDGITLDTAAPYNASIIINSGATYTTSRTVTLTLHANDATSGVAKVRFSENLNATWTQWYNYATTFSFILNSTGDGYKYIDAQFQDYAGNPTAAWTIWDGITLDITPPTGSIIIGAGDPAYTTTTSVTLYLAYSDATSGVDEVRYGNAGGFWGAWEASAATRAWNLSSGDGNKGVWYEVMDNAGNSQQFYDGIVLDTVAPTGSIIINSGDPPTTTTTAVTLYLTYNDATSGVYQVRYSNDGFWDTEPWEAPAATKAWTLTSGDGVKKVFYQIKDNAGLLSATYADTITLTSVSPAYLVVRGSDNKIYYRTYSGGSWGSWNVLPGSTMDSPAAAVCNNELHVVVRGSDGSSLWHGYVDLATSAFSGWTLLSGSTPSAPTLTSNGTVISLVVRGSDNRIYYRVYSFSPSRSWGSWSVVPTGSTQSSLAAAMLGSNLHIVVRGSDGTSIWNIVVKPGSGVVRNWILLSGATPSTPVLAANQTANKLYLTVRGADNKIYWRTYDGGADSWAGWNAVSTGTTPDAPAATIADNKLQIVVRDMTGSALYHGNVDLGTNAFSGWTLLSGSTPSTPILTS